MVLQSSYFGGSNSDLVSAIAVGTTGDVFIAGDTVSSDLPGSSGGAQALIGGQEDAFVARFNSTLTALLQSTYLGGSERDNASALKVHPRSGEVLLAGTTLSSNLPGTAGSAQSAAAGEFDGFIARLTSTLTTLLRATYLGGAAEDHVLAMVVHPDSAEIIVAGGTNSDDFPRTLGGAQSRPGGFLDAIVARLDPSLTALLQSTYLGGSLGDLAFAVGIDRRGANVLIAGETSSSNFPMTAGGAQPSFAGIQDGFVARLTADLGVPSQQVPVLSLGALALLCASLAAAGLLLIRKLF